MQITGWDRADLMAPQAFTRAIGRLTAYVVRLDGMAWGFSLWDRDGVCVAGRSSWNWTPEDACEAAMEAAEVAVR